jgi:hypothetical protein
MRYLACHKELESILGTCVVAEIDQPLIDDLGARLCCDVTSKIDVQLSGDFQIVRSPRIALGIEEIDSAAAGDRNKRVCLGCLAIEFRRFQVHTRQTAHDLEMTKFFSADIHEKILKPGILAIESLY